MLKLEIIILKMLVVMKFSWSANRRVE